MEEDFDKEEETAEDVTGLEDDILSDEDEEEEPEISPGLDDESEEDLDLDEV